MSESFTNTYIYTHIYTHIHIYIHTYIIYIYTHTHTGGIAYPLVEQKMFYNQRLIWSFIYIYISYLPTPPLG